MSEKKDLDTKSLIEVDRTDSVEDYESKEIYNVVSLTRRAFRRLSADILEKLELLLTGKDDDINVVIDVLYLETDVKVAIIKKDLLAEAVFLSSFLERIEGYYKDNIIKNKAFVQKAKDLKNIWDEAEKYLYLLSLNAEIREQQNISQDDIDAQYNKVKKTLFKYSNKHNKTVYNIVVDKWAK